MMTNILDLVAEALNMSGLYKGTMPHKPDECISLFEYSGGGPEHSFSGIDEVHHVQIRTRHNHAEGAYLAAVAVSARLARYYDGVISCVQSSPILDIGMDEANPPRHEYTINFIVRRY